MNRHIVLWVALGLFGMPVVGAAQDLAGRSLPASSEILGSDLIAWSEQQRPQPLPPATALDSQRENPSAVANAQSFRGRIIRDQSRAVVLQISEHRVYRLDNQGAAGLLEGKRVVVMGKVVGGDGLHVVSIQ